MDIQSAINHYLDSIKLSRADNTARTYGNALDFFSEILSDHNLEPSESDLDELSEESVIWMAS
ncbi:MAG: hypothetical protein GWN00_39465, partial [Aliifodinibius sp.]|nr:hypothetical protein [candidate division Zixibacteria bacterium]NIT62061.1 hypothetical protein [Fodinibius sp.]NIW50500.1 hypothetical protein [Gammaproteobacteria bacterium]NIY30641.1 hypothetical protein [Fodinibius sp.]